jgi:hypothetical protein
MLRVEFTTDGREIVDYAVVLLLALDGSTATTPTRHRPAMRSSALPTKGYPLFLLLATAAPRS